MMGLNATNDLLINHPNFCIFPPPNQTLDKYEGILENAFECWDIVMQWLNPMVSCSAIYERRVWLNRLQDKFKYQIGLDHLIKKLFGLSKVDRKTAREISTHLNHKTQNKFLDAINGFLNQSMEDDFLKYYVKTYLKGRKHAEKAFLRELNNWNEITVKKCIRIFYDKHFRFFLKKQWNELSLFKKTRVLRAFVMLECATFFGLQRSTWNFHKKPQDLVDAIKKEGPLMVQGYFGRPFYCEDPYLAEEVEGCLVYRWRPEAHEKNLHNEYHSILVVGARSDNEEGLVYFKDPLDSSKTLYVMSYAEFVEAIATSVEGIKAEKEWITPDATNFACRGPFKGYINENAYTFFLQVIWMLLNYLTAIRLRIKYI